MGIQVVKGEMVLWHLVEVTAHQPTILFNSEREPFEFVTAEQAEGVCYYLNNCNPSENWMYRGDHKYRLYQNGNGVWRSERN